jgi:2-polyprenyl-3-methyl-5-hydroxy-6-metoxy-1,4-benzoquinol methylase
MRNVLRVGQNGKVREVAGLSPGIEWEDLDTRVALIRALIPLGLLPVEEMLQREVELRHRRCPAAASVPLWDGSAVHHRSDRPSCSGSRLGRANVKGVSAEVKLRVQEVLEEVRGPDVLDVGCAGHHPDPASLCWLHTKLRERFNVVGIDISHDAVQRLRAEGFTNILVADAQDFALSGRFDTIVAGEVIEYLGRPEAFLRAAVRHLKPGGRIVCTTPYPFRLLNVLYALKNFPQTCSNPEHTMWFCPSTITEIARRAGLRVERWRLITDLEPGHGSALYRVFCLFIGALGWLIPKRLRCNAMLFVLVPDGTGALREVAS